MHTNLLLKVLSGVALDLKNGATAHQFGNLCPPSTKLSLKKVIKYSNFTVNAYTTQPHSYFFLHENGIHDSIKNMGSGVLTNPSSKNLFSCWDQRDDAPVPEGLDGDLHSVRNRIGSQNTQTAYCLELNQ